MKWRFLCVSLAADNFCHETGVSPQPAALAMGIALYLTRVWCPVRPPWLGSDLWALQGQGREEERLVKGKGSTSNLNPNHNGNAVLKSNPKYNLLLGS